MTGPEACVKDSTSGVRSGAGFSLEADMETDALVTIISTVGFPIAACCALFYYMNKQSENHKSEMAGLEKSLNENTTILMQLKEVMNFIIEELKKND